MTLSSIQLKMFFLHYHLGKSMKQHNLIVTSTLLSLQPMTALWHTQTPTPQHALSALTIFVATSIKPCKQADDVQLSCLARHCLISSASIAQLFLFSDLTTQQV